MKRVAILYPWNDPSGMDKGSALRVGLVAKYLKAHYEEVRLLSIDSECSDFDGVRADCYWPNPRANKKGELLSLLYRFWLLAVTLGKSKGRTFHLQQYRRFTNDSRFGKILREIVQWADVVLVEYTFFAAQVIRETKRYGKKVIVTDHDVVADNPDNARSGNYAKKAVLKKELKALRGADCAVSVCEEDKDAFLRYGVSTVCIPHGIEIRQAASDQDSECRRKELAAEYNLDIPPRPICLFVGSSIGPNVEAARFIEDIASAGCRGNPLFLVAGKCMEEKRGPDLIAFGYIEDGALEIIYSLATIIVIPLKQGTGASLKTIEAMSRGKAVIGTDVAFRGYPVCSGTDCIVENDIGKYPESISRLLVDTESRERIAEAAAAFARSYDYRIVYKRYLDLIEGIAS